MRGRVSLLCALIAFPFAAKAQPFEQIFSFTDSTVLYDQVVSDGVRNTYVAGRQGGQLFVQKLDELGTPVWSTVLPDTGGTRVTRILLDANQDIYVGSTFGTTDLFAMVTSLRRADGSVRWSTVFDCGDKLDAISDLAVAKVGNSVLLYQLTNVKVAGSNTDVMARRLNPATGAEVWRRQIGAGLIDKPTAIVANAAGAPYLAATIDNKTPTLFRLSGTDGSVVFTHAQSTIPNFSGNARGLTVLSDGRLGFLFDGGNTGGSAFGGVEIVEAGNGTLTRGQSQASSASPGANLWNGIAATRHATLISVFNSGSSFSLMEFGKTGNPAFLIDSTSVGAAVAVDQSDEALATFSGGTPKLRRTPSTAEFLLGTPATAIDVDNKDQITVVKSSVVQKIRQKVNAINDSFTRPLVAGKMIVAAPGVLRNDGGLTGATLELLQDPVKGTVVLNADGSFTYTAGPTFIGTDTFKYRITKDAIASTGLVTLNELKIDDHTIAASAFGGDDINGVVTFNLKPDADLLFEVSDDSSAVTSPPAEPMGVLFGVARGYKLKTAPVTAQATVTVSAKVQSLQTTVTFLIKPGGLKSLTAVRTSFVSGEATIGVVGLTAPRVGSVFMTSSSTSVHVPAIVQTSGANNAFNITTDQSFLDKTVTLTATLGSTVKTLSLQIAAMPKMSFMDGFANVVGGVPFFGGVNLNKSTPYNLDVALSVAPTTPMTMPASATVPKGQTFKSFEAPTAVVTADKTVTISASVGGATVTKTVKVIRNPLESVSISPTSVIGGTAATGTVKLNTLAPTDGVRVALFVNNVDVDIPQSVLVIAGSWSVDFSVLTKPVASNTTRTITAKIGAVTKTVNFAVVR